MNFKIFPIIVVSFILGLPGVLLAEDRPPFTPIVGIPGVADPSLNFSDYINALYALAISIAAIMAVIKIIIAGVKYMLSDVVTSKSEALSDIQGAIFGLIIVISSYLILYVINPQLIKMEVFMTKVVPVAVPPAPQAPPPPPYTGSGYSSQEFVGGSGNDDFRNSCTAQAGKLLTKQIPGDNNKPYLYCFSPLNLEGKSWILTNFASSSDMSVAIDKYQLVFPRVNNNASTKLDVATKLSVDQNRVLLVTEYKDPKGGGGDYVDYALNGNVNSLCNELGKLESHKKGVDMEKVKVGDKTYYACVEDD